MPNSAAPTTMAIPFAAQRERRRKTASGTSGLTAMRASMTVAAARKAIPPTRAITV
jgi:hypothetical protein